MIDLFYGLPIWLLTIVVLGLSLVIGLGASLGLRRVFRLKPATMKSKPQSA